MASSLLDVCRFTPAAGSTTDWAYSSAVTGYQSPAAAGVVNGATYSYRAESSDLSQWEIGTGTYNTGTGVLSRAAVLFNSLGTTNKVNFSAAPQVAIVALAEDLNAPPLPQKYWSGGAHSNNVTTPNTKIDIGSGKFRDSTDAFNIILSSGTLDCGTTGANGLDAGSLANSTQYYTFGIAKVDGTSALLATTSPTAPTLPSGYTYFRRIGSFRTDSSAHILAFHHINDKWYYDTAIRDLNASGTIGTSFTNVTMSVPAVQGVEVMFAMTFFHATLIITVNVMPGFMPSSAAAGFAYNISSTGGGTFSLRTQVDSSGRVQIKSNQSSSSAVFDTAGWVDPL